jgi:hypothetical protein
LPGNSPTYQRSEMTRKMLFEQHAYFLWAYICYQITVTKGDVSVFILKRLLNKNITHFSRTLKKVSQILRMVKKQRKDRKLFSVAENTQREYPFSHSGTSLDSESVALKIGSKCSVIYIILESQRPPLKISIAHGGTSCCGSSGKIISSCVLLLAGAIWREG